jgi:hypothetical protein
MPSRILLLLGVLAIVSSAATLAVDTWALREDGIGPIKIGMTLPQLNVALHEKFKLPKAREDQGCFYAKPARHHMSLMIENKHLVRIDIDKPGVPTEKGIQVGDSERHAPEIYGPETKVEEHKYNPDGHYLTVRSKDRRYGIRFETDKGKIEEFYAGTFEAIQYVEGCQ